MQQLVVGHLGRSRRLRRTHTHGGYTSTAKKLRCDAVNGRDGCCRGDVRSWISTFSTIASRIDQRHDESHHGDDQKWWSEAGGRRPCRPVARLTTEPAAADFAWSFESALTWRACVLVDRRVSVCNQWWHSYAHMGSRLDESPLWLRMATCFCFALCGVELSRARVPFWRCPRMGLGPDGFEVLGFFSIAPLVCAIVNITLRGRARGRLRRCCEWIKKCACVAPSELRNLRFMVDWLFILHSYSCSLWQFSHFEFNKSTHSIQFH